MCFVTLLVFACVQKPCELRLDVGKSTIGTEMNVTCMMSRTKSMSLLMPLLGNVLFGKDIHRAICWLTGVDRICIGDMKLFILTTGKEVWFWILFQSFSCQLAVLLKFTGFSECHPLYDESVMLNILRHAIYSSLSTESATASFLLLPNWRGLYANAYMHMLRKYPEHCTILGTIPQAAVFGRYSL